VRFFEKADGALTLPSARAVEFRLETCALCRCRLVDRLAIADQTLTRTLSSALRVVDVNVLDHFVVGGLSIVSFAESRSLVMFRGSRP